MKAALPLKCGLNLDFLRRSSPDEYRTSAVGILGKLSNIQSDHNWHDETTVTVTYLFYAHRRKC